MALDQCAQAEALVQLARQQQPGVGSHRRAAELDPKLGIEREANRASFCVTHWMMPSAPARHLRDPHFLRALSDYGSVDSPFKTKMWVNSCSAGSRMCRRVGLQSGSSRAVPERPEPLRDPWTQRGMRDGAPGR